MVDPVFTDEQTKDVTGAAFICLDLSAEVIKSLQSLDSHSTTLFAKGMLLLPISTVVVVQSNSSEKSFIFLA